MAFELTDQGLQTQTVAEILAEMEASARADVHPLLDCSATSPVGQLLGVWAEREALLQQTVLAVSKSFSPAATGQALANVALITGTVKQGATKSVVSATLTLGAGVTLAAGSRANVNGDTTAVFETLVDVTNSSGVQADVSTTMRAVNAGPVKAPAGSLTVINTPSSGWVAVTNALDAEVGSDIETDPALRTRREQELRVQGSTIISAIVADVLNVAGVVQVSGYENTTGLVNSDGLPAHSFEIVVWDGTLADASNDAVAQAILDAAPAGIQSQQSGLGTAASGTATDTEGAEHTVLFTRATQKTLYVSYTLTVDSSVYPADGDAQVKAAVVSLLNEIQGVGDDVIRTRLYAPAYSVAGVLDVTSLTLGWSASPAGTLNLAVGSREIAVADTSRITVTP